MTYARGLLYAKVSSISSTPDNCSVLVRAIFGVRAVVVGRFRVFDEREEFAEEAADAPSQRRLRMPRAWLRAMSGTRQVFAKYPERSVRAFEKCRGCILAGYNNRWRFKNAAAPKSQTA